MNGVKGRDESEVECQDVFLMKLKRVIGLRIDIDANNLKASLGVAFCGSTCTAEQIK